MATLTYTKSGNKASTAAKLDPKVFNEDVKSHDLLKQAYVTYLANGRENLAKTLKRGEVRGGGKKPWKQKGTGRARFGSIRVPIWRGGGITFGPLGKENYTKKMTKKAKQKAVRQALSLKAKANKVIILETFECKEGKISDTSKLLKKIGADRKVLLVVSLKDELAERATNNLKNVTLVQASYLNVYDIMNADNLVISKKSLDIINEWLSLSPTAKKEAK